MTKLKLFILKHKKKAHNKYNIIMTLCQKREVQSLIQKKITQQICEYDVSYFLQGECNHRPSDIEKAMKENIAQVMADTEKANKIKQMYENKIQLTESYLSIKVREKNKTMETNYVEQIKEHAQNVQDEKQKFIKQENGIYDDCPEIPVELMNKSRNIMEFYTNKDKYMQHCENLTQYFAIKCKEACHESIINANIQKPQILYVTQGTYNSLILKGKALAIQTEEIMYQLLQTLPFKVSCSVAIIIVILVMLTLTQKTIKKGYFLYSLAKNYLTELMQKSAQEQLLAKIKELILKMQQEIEKSKKNKYVDDAQQKLIEDALKELLKKLRKGPRRRH